MKKKFAAVVLCVVCLLSAVGCGQRRKQMNRRRRRLTRAR